jgi:LmbE family N-acetylglucosaminyl deacetylase
VQTLPSSRLLLSACPCRLPHVAVDDGEVFFGRLRDEAADDAERELLELADGRTTFGEILALRPHLIGAAARTRHLVWLAAPLVPPATPAPPAEPAGPLCLLLGAHPGDVELSLGGLVRQRRGSARFVHLCCFSRQVETRLPEAFASALEVTAIRRDEAQLAAAVLGLEVRYLDLPEFVLRQSPDRRERLILPPEEVEAALRIALHEAIAELAPAEVYAPAALGGHPDRRMLFDAVLDGFEQATFPGVRYHLYEDFPHAAAALHVDDFLARFEGAYLAPEPWFEEVSGALAEKLTVAELFRSRLDLGCRPLLWEVGRRNFRLARLGPSSETGPETGPEGAVCERFWTLRDATLFP